VLHVRFYNLSALQGNQVVRTKLVETPAVLQAMYCFSGLALAIIKTTFINISNAVKIKEMLLKASPFKRH